MDHAKKQASVYVLSSDPKQRSPIPPISLLLRILEPQFHLELAPLPSAGRFARHSLPFVATHENFGVERAFASRISAALSGVPYGRDFAEQPAQQ